MSKRTATELLNNTTANGQAFKKASISSGKRENVVADEMGEFEDAWEDEIENEEVVDADKQEDGMSRLEASVI